MKSLYFKWNECHMNLVWEKLLAIYHLFLANIKLSILQLAYGKQNETIMLLPFLWQEKLPIIRIRLHNKYWRQTTVILTATLQ